MLALVIICIGLLGLSAYYFTRSPFHPAVLFCAFWFIDLNFLWMAGDFFYPVHWKSLTIEALGAAAFSIGSLFASFKKPRPKTPDMDSTNRLITIGVWIVCLSIPLYLKLLLDVINLLGLGGAFLAAARQSNLEIQGTGLVANLMGLVVSLSTIVAFMAYRERHGHRFRSWVAIISAFVICFLTATKGGPVFLITGLLYLNWERTKRVDWKALAITGVVFFAVITSIEFFVHNDVPLSESAIPVARSISLYVSSPIVAFDQLAEQPNSFPTYNLLFDTTKRISNKFAGTHLPVAPIIPVFVQMGPYNLMGNTYTMYSYWYAFGPTEAVLAAGLFGFFLTLVYHRAQGGGAVMSIFYAILVPEICLLPYLDYVSSIWNTGFFLTTGFAIYYLPKRLQSIRALIHSVVKEELNRKATHG